MADSGRFRNHTLTKAQADKLRLHEGEIVQVMMFSDDSIERFRKAKVDVSSVAEVVYKDLAVVGRHMELSDE